MIQERICAAVVVVVFVLLIIYYFKWNDEVEVSPCDRFCVRFCCFTESTCDEEFIKENFDMKSQLVNSSQDFKDFQILLGVPKCSGLLGGGRSPFEFTEV